MSADQERPATSDFLFHATPKPNACDHDFKGWEELHDDDGTACGGTTVCTKCGLDAFSYSLRCGE